ncbi:MAG: nucleotide exchange factor GrpE [Nanoarchaeota archaeon]
MTKPKPKQSAEMEVLQAQLEDYKGTLQRLQAEFENFRKRMDAEAREFTKTSNANLIAELIEVLDDFDLAVRNANIGQDHVKGFQLVHEKLLRLLKERGLESIPTDGKFDPTLHEALMTEESSEPEGKILGELQRGYRLHGKVLRHARVKVARGPQ